MAHLIFKSSKSLIALAEATEKQKTFKKPYIPGETHTEKQCWLVKDDGIYLMPAFKLEGGTPRELNLVAYADGYDPDTNEHVWEDARYAVGGDDFAEQILLDGLIYDILDGADLHVLLSETQISLKAVFS